MSVFLQNIFPKCSLNGVFNLFSGTFICKWYSCRTKDKAKQKNGGCELFAVDFSPKSNLSCVLVSTTPCLFSNDKVSGCAGPEFSVEQHDVGAAEWEAVGLCR